MYQTFYIVPAFSDVAGQCRIVMRDSDYPLKNAGDNYREGPEDWREAGLMSSRGELRCLMANPETTSEIRACEPLIAGMVFVFKITE